MKPSRLLYGPPLDEPVNAVAAYTEAAAAFGPYRPNQNAPVEFKTLGEAPLSPIISELIRRNEWGFPAARVDAPDPFYVRRPEDKDWKRFAGLRFWQGSDDLGDGKKAKGGPVDLLATDSAGARAFDDAMKRGAAVSDALRAAIDAQAAAGWESMPIGPHVVWAFEPAKVEKRLRRLVNVHEANQDTARAQVAADGPWLDTLPKALRARVGFEAGWGAPVTSSAAATTSSSSSTTPKRIRIPRARRLLRDEDSAPTIGTAIAIFGGVLSVGLVGWGVLRALR